MLAVRLAQIFVQQNTMTDSETSIHAIHNKQKQICHIACLNNHTAQNKEDDKGDADRTYVARKTFSLAFRTEVEDTENQLSGIGFSLGKLGDERITVKVKTKHNKRIWNVIT